MVDFLRQWLITFEVVEVVQVALITGMVVVLVQRVREEAAEVGDIWRTAKCCYIVIFFLGHFQGYRYSPQEMDELYSEG